MAVENQGSDLGISNTIRVRESIVADPSYLSRGALRGAPPDLKLGVGDHAIAQQLADAFGQNFDYTRVANGPSAVRPTFSGSAGALLSFTAPPTPAADSPP